MEAVTTAIALVSTRLNPPTLPGHLVVRSRLNALLDAAVDDSAVRVVLVSAPAGSGKSTLIAGWQEQQDACAWMQADKTDRDPARFWAHVVAALASVVPDLAAATEPAVTTSGANVEPLLERLTNELAASARVVLVIDDYHLIGSAKVDEGLDRLIELAPPSLLFVLSSRVDPSLRLSRLRVRSQLVEIRADSLKFDQGEARLLLDERLTNAQATALCERTEGWAAGLVLAGLSLSGSADLEAFVEAFQGDDRLVVDYLTDEFLAGIDQAERERLLTTAILDRMSGPLVDAVCGTTDGSRWLRETAASNQLLIGLDTTGTWYRYHHLFEDVLRLEAKQNFIDLTDCHRSAARWHHRVGNPHEAVEHYLAAGDTESAADLIYDEATELVNRGQLRTVADQIKRLGPVAQHHAGAMIVQGWIDLLTGRFSEAHRCLERARTLAPGDDEAGLIVALAIMVHLSLGDVASALEEARAADDPFESTLAMTLGAARVWAGAFDDARPFLEQAQRMAPQEGHTFVEVVNPVFSAIANIETGANKAAQSDANRSLTLAGEYGLADLAQAALAHSVVARTIEDAVAAVAAAERGVILARRSPERITFAYALASGGDVLCHHGHSDGPCLIVEARSVVDQCSDPGIVGRYLARVEARHRISQPSTEAPGVVEDLTDREVAVLRYLPSPMSQRDIASELYVSVNTVKSHCRAIYRKLGVGDRKAAVQAARDASLL